jgi:hypothetical protein
LIPPAVRSPLFPYVSVQHLHHSSRSPHLFLSTQEGPKSKITAWPSTSYRSTQAVRNGRTPWLQNPCMDAILMHIFIHSSQPLQPNRSFAAASTPISANRHHHPSRYTTHGHLHGETTLYLLSGLASHAPLIHPFDLSCHIRSGIGAAPLIVSPVITCQCRLPSPLLLCNTAYPHVHDHS